MTLCSLPYVHLIDDKKTKMRRRNVEGKVIDKKEDKMNGIFVDLDRTQDRKWGKSEEYK